MRADRPFLKSFTLAGLLFINLMALAVISDSKQIGSAAITVFCTSLLLALITGTWSFFSKEAWSWNRFVATMAGLFVVFLLGIAMLVAIKAAQRF